MRRTYITKTPDQAGAFLVSARAIAENGGNIVRVNYNKAVDANALFMEVDASEVQHERIAARLKEIEYLTDDPGMRQIILIELRLSDRPGTLLPALEVIKRHEVNIPYLNSQENGTPYQNFKMGLLVENTTEIKDLIDDLSQLCEVHVLDYEATDRLLDSTVFYVTFANELRELLDLTQAETNEVLACSSQVMRTLDERKESPSETFEGIRQFARHLAGHGGDRFDPRVSSQSLSEHLSLHVIEPPCGCNVYVLEHEGALLFVNSGYARFEHEMEQLFERLFPGFETSRKSVVITDADVDTAGLLPLFDTVYLNATCYENFSRERHGDPSYRERKSHHAPYRRLEKIISGYRPPRLGRCAIVGEREGDELFEPVGSIRFGTWSFQMLEGAGGHARGEAVLVCSELRLAFVGGLVINSEGLDEGRRTFEELRPFLMTGVDTRPELAERCRERLFRDYADYLICPGRGDIMDRRTTSSGTPANGMPELA